MQNGEICTKYCTKAVRGRVPPAPAAWKLTALPQTPQMDREGRGTVEKGDGRDEKGRERKGGNKGWEGKGGRFSGYAHGLITPRSAIPAVAAAATV